MRFLIVGIIVLFCFVLETGASTQFELDSVRKLDLGGFSTSDKLIILYDIVRRVSDEDSVIKYSELMLDLSNDDEWYDFQANMHLGQALKNKGDYEKSLKYLLNALDLSQSMETKYETSVHVILGSIYGRIGDVLKMSEHFNYALIGLLSVEEVDSLSLVVFFNNYAEAYYLNEDYDSAYVYYSKSFHWAEIIDSEYAQYVTIGNLGMVNTKLGNLDTAMLQLMKAIDFVEEVGDIASWLTYETHLAEVYEKQGNYPMAGKVLLNCLETSLKHDLKEQIRDAYERLSFLYEQRGAYEQSLSNYKNYIIYRDSIENVETVRKMGDLRTEYEVGQKQIEVDLLTAQRKIQRILMIAIAAFAFILFVFALVIYKYYREKSRISQELITLNDTKDKFFSIISHDLRGPVSSFMGIGRMIKHYVSTKETDQLLEVADDIDQSVSRLSSLLDNLLNWAMQQQGQFPHAPEMLNLNDLIKDLTSTLHTMAQSKHIELIDDVEESIRLWGDKNTTMTILRNLVNNALKFTPEGGMVQLSAKKVGDCAEIRIKDTGVGIPAGKLQSLFQLQAKKSTYGTSGEKGLGLGLQLVYEFIEMNQGSVDVESEEGKGTVFIVKLPLMN